MPWPYLLVHLLLLTLLAASCTWAAKSLRLAKGIALFAVGVLLPLQLLTAAKPWLLANLTGWGDVLFFSQYYLHLALILAALATATRKGRAERLRSAGLGGLLLVLALVATTSLRTPPDLAPADWVDEAGVVRQTTPSTCAAAAAATLLRQLRIRPAASEAQLARLCLTDPARGTSDLGLFRGLVESAPDRAIRFAEESFEDLKQRRAPCLIFVGLDPTRVEDRELRRVLRDECGWSEGEIHAVVYCGFVRAGEGRPDSVLILDPRTGKEYWGLAHFRALWGGRVLEVLPG